MNYPFHTHKWETYVIDRTHSVLMCSICTRSIEVKRTRVAVAEEGEFHEEAK